MNNQRTIDVVFNVVLTLTTIICSVLLGILLYTIFKTPQGHTSEAFSHNMFFADKKSDTEIRYYNGNGFVSINPFDMQTKNLSTHQNISDVTQVFWLDYGAVFATSEVDEYSDLRPVMSEVLANDSSSQVGAVPTYWFLSFETNQIQAISTNVQQAEMFGIVAANGAFIFKDDTGSYSLLNKTGEVTYGVINLEQDSRPIYATENSLIYASEANSTAKNNRSENAIELKKIKFYAETGETITKNVFNDGIGTIYSQITMVDQDHLLVVRSKKDDKTGGDLSIFNIPSNKWTKVIKDFDGPVFKTGTGIVAIKQGRSANVIHGIAKDGISSRLKVSKEGEEVASFVAALGDRYLNVEQSGKATIVSKDKKSLESVKLSYDGPLEKEITNLPNIVSIARDIESVSDTSYSVTFNGKVSDAISIVRAAVAAKGHDPNQFTFTFVPGRLAEL